MSRTLRISLAVFISLAMLIIARTNSRGQPEHLVHVDGAYRFEMVTVPKIVESQSDTIRVTVSGPLDFRRVVFRTGQLRGLPPDQMDSYDRYQMLSVRGKPGEFFVVVTARERGGRFHYYFEVHTPDGLVEGRFLQADGSPFQLRYIGKVPIAILIGHVFFIFATVFCISMATIHAIPIIRGGAEIRPMAVYLFWAAVFCFIGGYPLGIPMNYYAFNGYWEGVPFGTDATDNKTQLLWIYLAFASLSTLGSLSRGKVGRDSFAPRTLGWIGLGTFLVMLFIYLIPHSIQFSQRFTYAFCYTWIALVAALYLAGWRRSRSVARV
ncbi:MAG: hypothetical protein AB1772_10255 [Candidatus Zixiibacteriota bacterium]